MLTAVFSSLLLLASAADGPSKAEMEKLNADQGACFLLGDESMDADADTSKLKKACQAAIQKSTALLKKYPKNKEVLEVAKKVEDSTTAAGIPHQDLEKALKGK